MVGAYGSIGCIRRSTRFARRVWGFATAARLLKDLTEALTLDVRYDHNLHVLPLLYVLPTPLWWDVLV